MFPDAGSSSRPWNAPLFAKPWNDWLKVIKFGGGRFGVRRWIHATLARIELTAFIENQGIWSRTLAPSTNLWRISTW